MNTMGQATLTTITAIFEEYKETLIDVIDDLTRHSYISRCQAQYLKMTKATLGGGGGGGDEVIFIEDFAENYQFLILEKIQSYRWSKEYCTLYTWNQW